MLLKKKSIVLLMMLILAFTVHPIAKGQDPNNSNSPQAGNGPDPGGEPAPIDGGLSLLVVAGVGYGVKKYRDGRKKLNEDQNDEK